MKNCTLKEFKKAIEEQAENTYFVDVRTPAEFEKGHIDGTINVALGEDFEEFFPDKDATYYIFCKIGGRSVTACAEMKAAGYKNIIHFKGSTEAWEKGGEELITS